MEYCYVLDYCAGSIYEIELDGTKEENYNEDTEELLEDYGLNANECNWMFSTDKLSIEPLKKEC